MNLRKWMGYNLYKKLWSLIGGRPWTFISRDIWHQFEIVAIFFLLFSGFFSGLYWDEILRFFCEHPMITIGIFSVASFLWYTAGHILWGKIYLPWEKGK